MDPISAEAISAVLVPLATGAAGEAGKQALDRLVTFVRARFGSRGLGRGQPPRLPLGAPAPALALEQLPDVEGVAGQPEGARRPVVVGPARYGDPVLPGAGGTLGSASGRRGPPR